MVRNPNGDDPCGLSCGSKPVDPTVRTPNRPKVHMDHLRSRTDLTRPNSIKKYWKSKHKAFPADGRDALEASDLRRKQRSTSPQNWTLGGRRPSPSSFSMQCSPFGVLFAGESPRSEHAFFGVEASHGAGTYESRNTVGILFCEEQLRWWVPAC